MTASPPGELLPVDDDRVRGRLVAITAALLVTTPTAKDNDTLLALAQFATRLSSGTNLFLNSTYNRA